MSGWKYRDERIPLVSAQSHDDDCGRYQTFERPGIYKAVNPPEVPELDEKEAKARAQVRLDERKKKERHEAALYKALKSGKPLKEGDR